MDWDFAIKRKRRELAVVIAALLAMAAACVGRDGRNAVLRIVRPAESALRRLIVIYARQKPGAGAQPVAMPPDFSAFAKDAKDRAPVFRLIDPRKRFDLSDSGIDNTAHRCEPRIWVVGMITPHAQDERQAETTPDTTALKRRIAALAHALKTLPAQARRLDRLMARRKLAPPGPGRIGPIRPGWPPGHRLRPDHDIDAILADCHALAVGETVWPPP